MNSTRNKKALLITYYWPPSGGSPVLRWLKFTKYLKYFGWDVSIYTPDNPVPQAMDEELLSEIPFGTTIYKSKIKEPANGFGFKSNKQKIQSTAFISEEGKKSLIGELAIWIRGNIFIPDARMFWIRPSVRKLTKLLKTEHFDAIITTGPPHSMHLIGLGLKKKTGIKWLADFRDPWTNIDYYPDLKLTKRADKKHHRLEQQVLNNADAIVTVSPTMTTEFEEIGGKSIHTITNGYDAIAGQETVEPEKEFSILHLGSMPKSRNPEQLWPVLGELCKENKEFEACLKIHLIGNVDHSILKAIDENGLNQKLFREGHLPNSEAILRQKQAQVLLLIINNSPNAKGILTNKFFEYMMAKRPILTIGPSDGDAATILEETGAGVIFDYNEKEKLKKKIMELFELYKSNKLVVDSSKIENYSRKNLAESISGILDSI